MIIRAPRARGRIQHDDRDGIPAALLRASHSAEKNSIFLLTVTLRIPLSGRQEPGARCLDVPKHRSRALDTVQSCQRIFSAGLIQCRATAHARVGSSSRQPLASSAASCAKEMDARVKPAHDNVMWSFDVSGQPPPAAPPHRLASALKSADRPRAVIPGCPWVRASPRQGRSHRHSWRRMPRGHPSRTARRPHDSSGRSARTHCAGKRRETGRLPTRRQTVILSP